VDKKQKQMQLAQLNQKKKKKLTDALKHQPKKKVYYIRTALVLIRKVALLFTQICSFRFFAACCCFIHFNFLAIPLASLALFRFVI
jgi:hypothetical protein